MYVENPITPITINTTRRIKSMDSLQTGGCDIPQIS